MRLVQDHQRAVTEQHIGEGQSYLPLAFPILFNVQPFAERAVAEMVLKIFVGFVDVAIIARFHVERLVRRQNDHGLVAKIRGADLPPLVDAEHRDRAAKCGFNGFTVGIARLFQRIECLRQDGVGRHQPDDWHERLFQKIAGNPDGVGGQQRLPAAGGQTDAAIRHRFQPFDRRIGAARISTRAAIGHGIGIGALRPAPLRRVEKIAQLAERPFLIVLKFHQRAFTS